MPQKERDSIFGGGFEVKTTESGLNIGTPGWWLFTRSRQPLGHTPERLVATATCASPISTWANVAGSLVAEYPLALGLSVID